MHRGAADRLAGWQLERGEYVLWIRCRLLLAERAAAARLGHGWEAWLLPAKPSPRQSIENEYSA